MTDERNSDADRIDDVARDWFLRLNDRRVTAAHRHAFEAWHRADPAHAAAYAEVEAAMRDLSVTLGPRRRRRAPMLAVLAAAGLALSFAPDALIRIQADHITATGAQQSITLPDGGVAQLNTNSALAVSYTPDRRVVRLLRGEAVFDVMPDPDRPFSVTADGAEALATGTLYGVRIGEDVSVTVLEGAVAVTSAGQTQEIATGEAVTFQSGDAPGNRLDIPEAALAWRDGFLPLDNMRLDTATKEIDRYLPGITVIYGEVAASRVAGQLALDSLEPGLEAVVATLGAEVTWVTPYLRIIR